MPALGTVAYLVNQASMELGITQRPVSSVVNTNDQDIVQMRTLMQAVADEVLMEEPYKQSLGDGIWLLNMATGLKVLTISADNLVVLIDARLMIDGLKFRFLKAKGLEFGEELKDFTIRMNKLARRYNARVLDLDDESGSLAALPHDAIGGIIGTKP